jgi:hypothetical protein
MKNRRYSGNDKHLGPFTLSAHDGTWKPLGLVLDSGGSGDSNVGCHLLMHGFGRTLILELPTLFKPWSQWVDCSGYGWAKTKDAGYWDVHATRYGFSVSDGFLQVFHGPQTMDSKTTKSKSYFLPWTQWRHIRFSLFDLNGDHFWTQFEEDRKKGDEQFQKQMDAEKDCPKAYFLIEDYDGEAITVTTHIQEREWRFGAGYFKWLSLFTRPKIRRSLDLQFGSETGKDKGSWKGGTMGHGIDMLPGELHESAIRRYCEQEHRSKNGSYRIKFVGIAPTNP